MNLPDYLSGSKTDRSLFGLTMEQISIAQSRADYLFLDYVLSDDYFAGDFQALCAYFAGQ